MKEDELKYRATASNLPQSVYCCQARIREMLNLIIEDLVKKFSREN
jgi:hypothetical protein